MNEEVPDCTCRACSDDGLTPEDTADGDNMRLFGMLGTGRPMSRRSASEDAAKLGDLLDEMFGGGALGPDLNHGELSMLNLTAMLVAASYMKMARLGAPGKLRNAELQAWEQKTSEMWATFLDKQGVDAGDHMAIADMITNVGLRLSDCLSRTGKGMVIAPF